MRHCHSADEKANIWEPTCTEIPQIFTQTGQDVAPHRLLRDGVSRGNTQSGNEDAKVQPRYDHESKTVRRPESIPETVFPDVDLAQVQSVRVAGRSGVTLLTYIQERAAGGTERCCQNP